MFIEYGQNVNKHDYSVRAILGKTGGVYVTYVVSVGEGQPVPSNGVVFTVFTGRDHMNPRLLSYS